VLSKIVRGFMPPSSTAGVSSVLDDEAMRSSE